MKNNTEQLTEADKVLFRRIDRSLNQLFSDFKELRSGSDAVNMRNISTRVGNLAEQLQQLRGSNNPVISEKAAEYERHTNQLKKMIDIVPLRENKSSMSNRS